jgi:uncharacterized repeat protein (TIGR03847 family)
VSQSFEMEAPDHFTAGTVGPVGQRVFYLQAREAGQVLTLKLEKEQVGALAEYLGGVLDRLPTPGAAPPDLGLLEPVEEVWAVGSLGAGYDEASDRVIIVATELIVEEESEEEEGEAEEPRERTPPSGDQPEPATARFRVTRAQAAAFVERARALVKAGRPICPICSRPKDPGGHVCARANGHPR